MPTKNRSKTSASSPARSPAKRPSRSGVGVKHAALDEGETLSDRAYNKIEEMLVMLEIPPGTLMSELELGRRLGISRTPVGEALNRLSRSGLVTILPRRGFIATELNVSNQLRLLELRREIARLVARAAALRALPHQRSALMEIARQFVAVSKTGDEKAYMKADQAFHALVGECAQNEYALLALETLDSQTRRFWFANRHHSGAELTVMAPLHADMATAIEQGKVEEAGAASDVLSDCLEKFARCTIDPIAKQTRSH